MSYEWPVDVAGLFGERYAQMINTGLPVQDVDAVGAAITTATSTRASSSSNGSGSPRREFRSSVRFTARTAAAGTSAGS